MTRPPRFSRKWKSGWHILLTLFSAILAVTAFQQGGATGFYGPQVYLDNGGKQITQSPEFYWQLEVERLAKGFKPQETLVVAPVKEGQEATDDQNKSDDSSDNSLGELTAAADLNDFAGALKEGRIKPDDAAKATAQHEAARKFIAGANDKTTDPLPEEYPSEFADYHRGALAYREGKWDEAQKEWEALLQRPAEERHYRTVWAAFMLGKAALKKADPQAVKWFQDTRDFAKTGFADSLGMAADSYGWEGRSQWKQGHPEKAAPLFLTQLALGDDSAVVSLKALIPDREPVDGMLNYGPEPEEKGDWNDQKKKAEEEKTLLALKAAAQDPLLRRLVTVHILGTESVPDLEEEGVAEPAEKSGRLARWLSVIKDARVGQMEDAEYLGWLAYINGNYKEAEHWLDLAKGDTPAALWLRAKLQRRAGKLDDAAKSMVQAREAIDPIKGYTEWKATPDSGDDEYSGDQEGGHWTFPQSVSGDLGALQLERADFMSALDVFLKGKLWDDMAFVAERILTADELKAYVDRQPIKSEKSADGTEDPIANLRYLLGRRLVREDRYDEAAPYLRAPYDQILARYVKALQDGANEKLSKKERARAWFTAAWLARYDGMELMGSEGVPDGFSEGGDSELPDLGKQQQSGVYQVTQYVNNQEKTKNVPIVLKLPKQELPRLAKNKIIPDVRFHYRLIAGALAIRAAGFLEDNSEELADVVNTAGTWVKDRDEKTGDRYYQILEKRAAKTKIGSAAVAKHWFVDQTGPWSDEQQTAHDQMRKDLGIDQ